MTTLNQRPKQHEMTWGAEGDLGGYTFTPEELQQATAQYHVEQDMEAMAARIDQLQAENDRLQREADKRLAQYIAKNEQYLASKGLIP